MFLLGKKGIQVLFLNETVVTYFFPYDKNGLIFRYKGKFYNKYRSTKKKKKSGKYKKKKRKKNLFKAFLYFSPS